MAGGYLEVGSYDTVIALLSLLWLVTWGLVGSDGGGIFRSWILRYSNSSFKSLVACYMGIGGVRWRGGYLEVGSYDTVIALLSLLWLVTWGLVGSDGGGIFRSWILRYSNSSFKSLVACYMGIGGFRWRGDI